MKTSAFIMSAALALVAVDALALTPQQEKMQTCNAQAGARKLQGESRQSFMKQCLSAAQPATPPTPQQQKMKTCNAEATAQGLKGPARKGFLSECLANPAAMPAGAPATSPAPAPTPPVAPPAPVR